MKIYFEKYVNKKFIIVLPMFFASLILFAKKLDDDLKFCVDFKKLNKIMKKIIVLFH